MSNCSLDPIQAFHKVMREMPDFGMAKWKWEIPFREDPANENLTSYKITGFKELRKEAISCKKKNVCRMLLPVLLTFLFLLGEIINLYWFEFIDIKLSTITTIAAFYAAIIIWLSSKIDKQITPLKRTKVIDFLEKQLKEKQILELKNYSKPKGIRKFFIYLLGILLFLILLLPIIHYVSGDDTKIRNSILETYQEGDKYVFRRMSNTIR